MRETYWCLGFRTPLLLGLLLSAMYLWPAIQQWRWPTIPQLRSPQRQRRLMIGYALASILCVVIAVFALPIDWLMLPMIPLLCSSITWSAKGKWKHPIRVIRVTVALGPSVALVVIALPKEIMTLRDDTVEWSEYSVASTFPRTSLRVNIWRSSGSDDLWGISSGDNPGPRIEKNSLYYGPHGFMRSDQVWVRFLQWSGVKPTVH